LLELFASLCDAGAGFFTGHASEHDGGEDQTRHRPGAEDGGRVEVAPGLADFHSHCIGG